VPPLPIIERQSGELRFVYEPQEMEADATALFGYSAYRMPMPCSVNIDFTLDTGARRVLWMTASPIDERTCRTFWVLARSDAWDEPDEAHFAFQQVVLDEDEPVVCGQVPGELPMDTGTELSVRTDKVSIEYRRWIRELAAAALDGPDSLRAVLDREVLTTTR
jgi:phenylpropionate dioxygenase-like ring-hydroxylating dioxygenase large terminal subunit